MKKSLLLILMFCLQLVCIAQTSNWENKFVVSDSLQNYKFEIIKSRNYYIIKYYCNCDSVKNEISFTDTLELLNDIQVLKNSIKKLIQNDTSSNRPNYDSISKSLFKQYSNRSIERQKNNEKQFIDNMKGEKVGIISSKVGPASWVTVYSIKKDKDSRKYLRINDYLPEKETVTKITQSDTIRAVNKITTEKIEIDSIDIAFNQGIIQNIIIRSRLIDEKGKTQQRIPFSNRNYIPIRNAEDMDILATKGVCYLTSLKNKNTVLFLDLADVIEFNRRIPFSSGTYIPKDTVIYIVPGDINKVSLYKPSISESFDIKVFSDLVGYNSEAPNGIIQTEAQVDFTLKTAHRKVKLSKTYNRTIRPINSHQLYFIGRISPYFLLARIENSKSPFYIDSTQSADLLDLFKYSHLNVGTELNLATYRTNSKSMTLNLAGGIYRTKIGYDSIEQNNFDKSTIYMNPNLNLYFFESGHLDFNLKFGLYAAWTVKNINSSSFNKITESIQDYAFDKSNYWGQFQQSINIHPDVKKNNSIFIRSSQYLGDDNNYFSFQIGFSTTLGNLLNIRQ